MKPFQPLVAAGEVAARRQDRVRACLLDVLKFNEHYITFVLFDKKFLILN
jgi:hypothetical protein